ncbi:MAG: acyl-CoA dehydratase activase [Bacilli bacterium]
MHFIGIDVGSTNCKIVLYKNKIIDYIVTPTTWNPQTVAKESIELITSKNNIAIEDCKIIATGYGRGLIDMADLTVTEISCHAIGGYYLNDNISGIIDIGGQDCKIMQLDNGKLTDFYMNDKCAAGTGSFLSMTCNKLGIDLCNIDSFIKSDKYVKIGSMCAVFAESEIIGLMSNKVSREMILNGVIVSISNRIKQMTSRLNFNSSETLLMTGGLASSEVIIKNISKQTQLNVISNEKSIITGALGAALHGKKIDGDF